MLAASTAFLVAGDALGTGCQRLAGGGSGASPALLTNSAGGHSAASGHGARLAYRVSFGRARSDSLCIVGGLGFEVSSGLSVGDGVEAPSEDGF